MVDSKEIVVACDRSPSGWGAWSLCGKVIESACGSGSGLASVSFVFLTLFSGLRSRDVTTLVVVFRTGFRPCRPLWGVVELVEYLVPQIPKLSKGKGGGGW